MSQPHRVSAHDALVSALACGATVEHAARKAGLSERTVYRRLADPAFRAQVSQKRAELMQRVFGMLATAGLVSVKTLVDLQHDAAVPAAVKRGAARDVLAMSLRYAECTDLAQRLAAVEDSVRPAAAGGPAGLAETVGGAAAAPTPGADPSC